jgi:hypothetical protein
MSIRTKVSAAAFAVGLSVTPAFAEVLDFTLMISPGDAATWSQPSDPTPVTFRDGVLTVVQISDGKSSSGAFTSVTFFPSGLGGGLAIDSIANVFGVQVYTGSEEAPIFAPGRYATQTGSLTVTAAVPAIPEPSTWAMGLIGFAGLGYAAVRRKRATGAIFA